MTDHIKGLTVVFEEDLRKDDAQVIIDAIELIRGVVSVTGVKVVPSDYFQRTRIKHEMAQRMWDFLKET